ncbi:ImmA/IrrE family metallo-endopeptidase [Vibrio parahaemolyticus]|uniref:ImmA/IrrE family metallo-endopeptidase n=1 Tax=Vibrio parahaemolyticus TaxID=670 RepID=UPI0009AACE3A|nr:ImmA/IrrE family metallo-endopeptidase [Vibrio parahaemolyticus]MDS1924680.1 ImmA/IrrE family metallo-endopeptidase [Vibrio parahaemolyticus]
MAIRPRKHQTSRNETVLVSGTDNIDHIQSPVEVLDRVRERLFPGEDILNAIARIFNIRVEYRPLELDASGSLRLCADTDQWVVTINSLHHPKRQRFTFAHELAHYFLHRNSAHREFNDTVFFRAESVKSTMEYEANNFAGALLMPKEEFIDYIRNYSNSIENVSSHFNVSAMAVKVRADVIRGSQYEF